MTLLKFLAFITSLIFTANAANPDGLMSSASAGVAQKQTDRPAKKKKAKSKKEKEEPEPTRGAFINKAATGRVESGAALDGQGRLWAVVIGVSNYKNLAADAQLRFAHRDAEDFAAFLRSPGGGGFPSTHIRVLLNQGATLAAIRTALGTWLARSAEAGDVVYVFFAGHGVVEGASDGYLLAHDSDPQNLYATALSAMELDNILTNRLRARITVVLADACHSGKLGPTARNVGMQVLINRYLDEVGQSGKGIYKILASRADELSFEDRRWGGGHGVFTHFLLQGLNGKADRDQDGAVRAGELLDYLSEVVPAETNARQHPRAAGDIDPRLPVSVVSTRPAAPAANVAVAADSFSLQVRGAPGSEFYVDNAYKGRIRPNGMLVVEGLRPGRREISVDPPGAETFTQTIALTAEETVLDLSKALPARAAVRSSPLVAQIRTQLAKGNALDPGGAWELYQQLLRESPNDPQREALGVALRAALEEVGQRAVNSYVRPAGQPATPATLRRAAAAYANITRLGAGDAQLEAKRLLCEGRALIAEGKNQLALVALRKSVSLDPKQACSYAALGVAYERTGDDGKAQQAFKQAAELAPDWGFPRLRLAAQYYAGGRKQEAEREFKAAAELDPRQRFSRWILPARALRERGRYSEAEKEVADLLRQAPNYAPAHFELGLIYEAAKEHKKAADAFDACLRALANTKTVEMPEAIDANAVRQRAARNRQMAQKKPPRLKRR